MLSVEIPALLLDSIDMQVDVPRLAVSVLTKAKACESSVLIAKGVVTTVTIQLERQVTVTQRLLAARTMNFVHSIVMQERR